VFNKAACATCVAACAVVALVAAAPLSAQQPPAPPKPSAALTDLDVFMAKVLEKRSENWRTLHDYILSEREVFELLGPADIPLHTLRVEFQWFVRDGYLVRSPVTSNGVAISEDERRRYEEKWLTHEKAREEKARDTATSKQDPPQKAELKVSVTGDVEFSGFEAQGLEPRFISESNFMQFKFEPGNYYFAGREKLDGRDVLKIEYLPSNLFDEHDEEDRAKQAEKSKAGEKPRKPRDEGAETNDEEERINHAMNKTSTVTLWVDPREHQIVRYTFNNVDWGFLPGRQLVRVDETRASMTMGREFENIWLPHDVTFSGTLTVASGTVRARYSRAFFDYRRGEVSAKIRGYEVREPRP
jgi:hypothetical protein